jgi:hypothetical protein
MLTCGVLTSLDAELGNESGIHALPKGKCRGNEHGSKESSESVSEQHRWKEAKLMLESLVDEVEMNVRSRCDERVHRGK